MDAVRRPLRLVDRLDDRIDLDVDVSPEATVGDLADRLAAATGRPAGGTVASRWPLDHRADPPARSRPLRTHGPRAGSTVELLGPSDAVTAAATAIPTSDRSPVRLIGPDHDERRLDYGANLIGDTLVEVADHVAVRGLGGATTRVGGAALLGTARVRHGDLLTICDTTWTVCIDATLRPPRTAGWTIAHSRRPRIEPPRTIERVVPPTPPPSARVPGFPLLSAMVPLLMGVALWFATGSLLGAGFMLFSVVFVVASGIEARREARAEDRARVAEFRQDLADMDERLEALARHQRASNERPGLSPDELRHVLDPARDRPHERIWERCSTGLCAPSLLVRLGTATRPLEVVVPLPDTGRRELRQELHGAVERRSAVDDVVLVDLADCTGLVVESTDEAGAAAARAIVVQLATLISPDELGLTVLTGDGRASAWQDVAWLPHPGSTGHPVHLVVADGAELHELQAMLDQLGHDGVAVLWVTTPGGPRPSGAGALLQVDGPTATLELTSTEGTVDRIESLAVDQLDPDEAHPLARSLAALAVAPELWLHRPGLPAPTHDRGLPAQVTLADLLASPDSLVDPTVLADRWAGSGPDHLAAPIGVAQGGGVVNVDLVADGPHALVAGTTGAGKSELLRSWLLSAALHHPPDRLHLLLVDYKGGAAFGPLGVLPHTVGTITDLTEQLARRALVSLRAEVRRREELIAECGGDRWDGARLVVVVDEFATLAAELPDFVDGLVDLAQRGRSLGIHLVLATQRPAGVVTDAIRANTTMRLALRVADEDDSRNVVDTPAAARLPRDAPGRAVLRIGPSTAVTVQVGWSGAAVTRREPVVVRPLRCGGASADTESLGVADDVPTQLDAAVATIRAATELSGIGAPRRPWLDPLPTSLSPSELPPPSRPGSAVVGLVDRPDAQGRDPLVVDLDRDGGLVVVGASGSGRTTVLRCLVAAVDSDPHDSWAVYAIDGGSGLGDLMTMASVGDVVGVEDTERVLRLLRTTVAELARRAAGGGRRDAPRWLLAVDGIGQLEERYERVDRGEALDLLARIARDGRSMGLHLAVTAQRRAEVPIALSGALGGRILLRCATPDEAALWGLPDDAASPEVPPGRCVVGGHVAQVADMTPRSHQEAASRRDRLAPVPTLPTELRLSPDESASPDEWRVAVGRDGDTLGIAHLDLRHHHAIVAGPPRSGVSTALQTLVAHHPRAQLLDADTEPADLVAVVHRLIEAAADGHPRLLAVDDLPAQLDGPDEHEVGAALTRVLEAGRRLPVRLVVGGEVEALSQCFHDVVATLRRGRTGLLLGGDPELHGALWHAHLRQLSDLPPAPGRGWLLGPGSARRVQVALT